MSFAAHWASDIWPALEAKHNQVLEQRPAKQDTATGTHYGEKVFQALPTKREVRNVACNLAYTDPTGNTMLQKDISFATVERFAIDMYVDVTHADTAEDGVAASAAADKPELIAAAGAGGRQAEIILKQKLEDPTPDAQGL